MIAKLLPDNDPKSSSIRFALIGAKDVYTMLHPLVACKDWLSDYLWSEAVKQPATIAGVQHKPNGIRPIGVMVYYPSDFEENTVKTVALVNFFGKLIGIDAIQYDTLRDPNSNFYAPNSIAYVLPQKWLSSTQHISLFTLLVRISPKWDMKIHPKTFLDQFTRCKTPPNGSDPSYVASIKSKTDAMFNGTWEPKLQFSDLKNSTESHSAGICGYDIYERKVYGVPIQ